MSVCNLNYTINNVWILRNLHITKIIAPSNGKKKGKSVEKSLVAIIQICTTNNKIVWNEVFDARFIMYYYVFVSTKRKVHKKMKAH